MDAWKLMEATAAAAAAYYATTEASSFDRYLNEDAEAAAYHRALESVGDEQLARDIAASISSHHGKVVRADLEGAKQR